MNTPLKQNHHQLQFNDLLYQVNCDWLVPSQFFLSFVLERTWREIMEKDCQACKLNKENAMDRSRWRKLIKDVWWSGWVWVGECFFWYRPTWVVPDKKPLNSCVCVCCSGKESLIQISCMQQTNSVKYWWKLKAAIIICVQTQTIILPRYNKI